MRTPRKLIELRAKIWTQNLHNNANHGTANYYFVFGKIEILKQKNTSVDIPNTRKLDGLQQAPLLTLPVVITSHVPKICTF
jgi:hypothetical protein